MNVGNERGEILNSVLTIGEGAGVYQQLCQGIVKRYKDADKPPSLLIYVDRVCCSTAGDPPPLKWFQPWRCQIRLNIWHFMRRFNPGLTTEHHPLYGIWCQCLSSHILCGRKMMLNSIRELKTVFPLSLYVAILTQWITNLTHSNWLLQITKKVFQLFTRK